MSKRELKWALCAVLLLSASFLHARADEYDDDDEEGGAAKDDDEKDVVVLTTKNFDEIVKKSKYALVSGGDRPSDLRASEKPCMNQHLYQGPT